MYSAWSEIHAKFLSGPMSRFRKKEGDDMCFAGIEENVRGLVKKKELAEEIAAKAHVRAITTQVWHGHVHVLVEDEGWVRSVDLLDDRKAEGFEPITRPASVRIAHQIVAVATR